MIGIAQLAGDVVESGAANVNEALFSLRVADRIDGGEIDEITLFFQLVFTGTAATIVSGAEDGLSATDLNKNRSTPVPPYITSWPEPPISVSSPVPPSSVSLLAPPSSRSFPAPPTR